MSGGEVNVAKSLDEGTPIAVWNRLHGVNNSAKMIGLLITDMVNSYNVNRPMTPGQIADIALDMTNELWWVKMEELGAFFEAMKRGTYGKIYERLDSPMIWECWSKYVEHRQDIVEHRRAMTVYADPTITQPSEQTMMGGGMEKLAAGMKQLREQFNPNENGNK